MRNGAVYAQLLAVTTNDWFSSILYSIIISNIYNYLKHYLYKHYFEVDYLLNYIPFNSSFQVRVPGVLKTGVRFQFPVSLPDFKKYIRGSGKIFSNLHQRCIILLFISKVFPCLIFFEVTWFKLSF